MALNTTAKYSALRSDLNVLLENFRSGSPEHPVWGNMCLSPFSCGGCSVGQYRPSGRGTCEIRSTSRGGLRGIATSLRPKLLFRLIC